MKVKQVLKKYQKKVAFPLTQRKIRNAGYKPLVYLADLVREIKLCDDYDRQKSGF